MAKKIDLTIEEKFELVKRHYENSYKDPITRAYVKFKRMPEPHVVNYLFTQMLKIYDAEYEFKRAQDEKRNK